MQISTGSILSFFLSGKNSNPILVCPQKEVYKTNFSYFWVFNRNQPKKITWDY